MDIILFFVFIVLSFSLVYTTIYCENGGIIFLAHVGSALLLAAAIYFFAPALNDVAFWIQNIAFLGGMITAVFLTFASMFRVTQYS